MKTRFLCLSVVGLVLGGHGNVGAAEKPLQVVATLSTFADLAKTIGGDHVAVSSIASPKFNPHFIEPKPSDVLKVKRADLFLHGGLDLELWRGPLLDAAGNRDAMPGGSKELDLSPGIELLEVPTRPMSRADGDIHIYGNPHYWLDPENAKIMAQTICEKLSAIDPSNEPDYRKNLQAWLSRLDRKLPEWRGQLVSHQGQELVGDHRAWPYLMRFLGLKMEHELEPKPGIPPTPRQIQFLERYMNERHIPVIVRATYFQAAAADALAKRTGANVVSLCTNVGETPACSDYIAMLDYDVSQLAASVRGSP